MATSKLQFRLLSFMLFIAIIAVIVGPVRDHFFSNKETINWIHDSAILPHSNQYVLIATSQRVGVGQFQDGRWEWGDGGGVEQPVDAWSVLPHGPYANREDRINY